MVFLSWQDLKELICNYNFASKKKTHTPKPNTKPLTEVSGVKEAAYRVIDGVCIDEVGQQITNPQRQNVTQQARDQTTEKKNQNINSKVQKSLFPIFVSYINLYF